MPGPRNWLGHWQDTVARLGSLAVKSQKLYGKEAKHARSFWVECFPAVSQQNTYPADTCTATQTMVVSLV